MVLHVNGHFMNGHSHVFLPRIRYTLECLHEQCPGSVLMKGEHVLSRVKDGLNQQPFAMNIFEMVPTQRC